MSLINETPHSMSTCERSQRDAWFLLGANQPGDSIRHFPIDNDSFIVGRSAGASMKLRFKTVSGRHAAITIKDDMLCLTDLGSTNGTYVNGKRITGSVTINEEDLIHFAEAPFRVRCQSPTGQNTGTISKNVCDEALALVQFDRLMSDRLVRPHFQPIVKTVNALVVGYEILGRGSVFGLESVGSMFQAAEQLNLEVELSQMLRWEGIRVGRSLPDTPMLFVNTHPKEMENCRGLIESIANVRPVVGDVQLVLEIHEAAVTDRHDMRELSAALLDMDVLLAFDDFGSGQARLAELIESKPHYVKFDQSLINDIDSANEQRQRMIHTLVQMVRDLDICALAEGVETQEEAKTCREFGFELAQGYFYGRPSPV